MSRRGWVLIGLFALTGGACANSSTATTLLAPTTTGPPTTATTSAPTTTLAPTTTTAAPTTTASPSLEGNWGSAPLVASSFFALGWWDGAAWAQVEDTTTLPVVGGEDYQVALLGQEAIITGGPPATFECGAFVGQGVVFENEQALGEWPGPIGVAISAPWVIVPHPVAVIEDDGTYATVATELVAERGLDVPNASMKQVIRVDLEGDGVDEVLAVAERVSGEFQADQGDYSIVFLRRMVDGVLMTDVLLDNVVAEVESSSGSPTRVSYSVAALADLNDDARMEMVLNVDYGEAQEIGVWELLDKGPVPQMGTGCGA